MPAGEERDACLGGEPLQVLDLADGGARRLFHEDVLAGLDGRARRLVAELRRHAQRHGVDADVGGEHFLDRREIGDAVDGGVAAGRGDQIEVAIAGDGRQVLVANDLADADNG